MTLSNRGSCYFNYKCHTLCLKMKSRLTKCLQYRNSNKKLTGGDQHTDLLVRL